MKTILKSEDYERIEKQVKLEGNEDFVVCIHRRHNKINFSIHVFDRQPMTQEIVAYEETASKMKFKGTKAQIEGSQVLASKNLYDRLISRVYDLPVGRQNYPLLMDDEARRIVPALVKREAIRDFVGGVVSANAMADSEGEEGEVVGSTEGD